MSAAVEHYDIIVIGSGPAGQKAAIQGAKAGRRILLVERGRRVGGACVHHGTIPSKTLRETAAFLSSLHRHGDGRFDVQLTDDVRIQSLMGRLHGVVAAHETYMERQLDRNLIDYRHGRASLVSANRVAVQTVRGEQQVYGAEVIVIATGSVPRDPPDIGIDHEHVLDSDSILSLTYLPRSLTVLGGGVIACEYASIFAALGTRVSVVDRAPRPLGFLDHELTRRFVDRFESFAGCRYWGAREVADVRWDGTSQVVAELTDGEVLRAEKMFVALGRVANLDGLGIERVGLFPTSRGVIEVDEDCRTAVPNIYAVGDAIGPPALASTSMEQGRRAVRHALGLASNTGPDTIPVGIYTIPEISTVGATETEVNQKYGSSVCGEARFDELARAQICGSTDGYLKLVADPAGRRLCGAQIFGEGATELIHLAQLALQTGSDVDLFIDSIFNFPTFAEAYRVAALQIAARREAEAEAPVPLPG